MEETFMFVIHEELLEERSSVWERKRIIVKARSRILWQGMGGVDSMKN